MNVKREIPKIRNAYETLRSELNSLCDLLNENGFEIDTPVKAVKVNNENKKLLYTTYRMEALKRDCEEALAKDVSTPEAKLTLKQSLRKLIRMDNPYCTSKRKDTFNEVYSRCFSAMNFMKLEIALVAIKATKGSVEDASHLSKVAIKSINATSSNDTQIFSMALAVAKADGVNLTESKNK